jgi:hypothetical protein
MIQPGQIIKLNDDDLKSLGGGISEIIDDYENAYRPLFDDIRVWWKWHDAVPRLKVKNFPFANSSNLVVPLIQIMSDAMVARVYGSIFSTSRKIWIGKTENELLESQVNNVIRWINWAANDNDFNFRTAIYDWLSELVPIGSSVLALKWRDDVRSAFARQGSRKSSKIISRPVMFAHGPLFEHVPREQILWDTSVPIQEAPVVIREYNYSWSWINHLATMNEGWNRKAVEEIQGTSAGVEGPSREVRDEKATRESRQPKVDLFEEHDLREVTLDWPVLRSLGFEPTNIVKPNKEELGQPSVPIVVTLHRKSKKVLWVRSNPYFFPFKPYFDGYIKKRSGRGHGVGLAKKLEHMQQAMTAILNQSIDARTRANAIWAKTTRREFLNKPINPEHPIYVGADINSFMEMKVDTNILQDQGLMNVVQILSERLTGQAEPALGRESRQGGHPSPATSTLALLQQGDIMALPTKDLLRMQVSRMGEAVASLYQQFETNEDGRLQRILGDRDAADVEQFLFPTDPISSVMKFDVVAMNESTNPQTEMSKAVTVTQMNTNYWAFVLRATQVMQQATQQGANPMVLQMALKSIEAQTEAHKRFLEASDIDDIETYIFELNRGLTESTNQLQTASNGLREVAQANGAAQGSPGLGGPGGSPGGGTLVAPGGFGLQ